MTKLDMTDPADVVLLDRLRALRLWHWLESRAYRIAQQRFTGMPKEPYDKLVSFHLTHVQTLNEFFEIGDTAERDANETAN